MALSPALELLRKIEEEENEIMEKRCEETILRFLEKHPDGKQSYPMNAEEMNSFMEFTTARAKLESLEKKRKQRAAADAAEEILRETEESEEPESYSEYPEKENVEIAKPNPKRPLKKNEIWLEDSLDTNLQLQK